MVPRKNNIIYGVDVTKNVTPIMVRDAIIQCFYEAHHEVLELAKETFGNPPEKKFEEMKKKHVTELIYDTIHKAGGDFDKPTREDLLKTLKILKGFASIYRAPEVIKKHVSEIILLINKLE